MTLYDPKEVATHNHKNSLWVVHKGSIYDVTEFSDIHPGGREYLLEHAGGIEDVRQVMQDKNVHVHSRSAYNILKKNYIGKLSTAVINDKVNANHHHHSYVVACDPGRPGGHVTPHAPAWAADA
jgi:4-hydroxysphinganine ceramide fatty acyl 2-hydroxylase